VPDLSEHGLPDPGIGAYRRAKRGEIPILDVGLIEHIQAGAVEPVPCITGFDGRRALLADGSAIEPDVILAATGYRRGLEPLVGHLGLLGASGRPTVHGARNDPRAPGIYFIGFTNPVSGMFREIAIDSRRIARAVAGEVGGAPAAGHFDARALAGRLTRLVARAAG
jgi:putative flavoprotein involved in K+ transport